VTNGTQKYICSLAANTHDALLAISHWGRAKKLDGSAFHGENEESSIYKAFQCCKIAKSLLMFRKFELYF
jgi:hypothetical protein